MAMGYYYTAEPENAVPPKFWATPKTHVPGSPVKERGYRFYMPEVARFITEDPIGEDGGMNLYGFVDNDPIGYVDFGGLAKSAVDYEGVKIEVDSDGTTLSGSAAMDIPNYTYGLPYVGTLVEVRGKGTVGWTTSLNSLGEKECILKEETPSSKSSGKFTKYLPPYYSYNKRYETSYGHAEVTAGFGINKKLSLLLDVATEQEAKTVVWAGGAICKCFDLKLTSQAEVHGEASLGKAALFYAVIYNAESIAVKLSKWGWKVINLPSPGDPVPVPGY